MGIFSLNLNLRSPKEQLFKLYIIHSSGCRTNVLRREWRYCPDMFIFGHVFIVNFICLWHVPGKRKWRNEKFGGALLAKTHNIESDYTYGWKHDCRYLGIVLNGEKVSVPDKYVKPSYVHVCLQDPKPAVLFGNLWSLVFTSETLYLTSGSYRLEKRT